MFGMMFLKQVRNDSVDRILAPAEKTAQGRDQEQRQSPSHIIIRIHCGKIEETGV